MKEGTVGFKSVWGFDPDEVIRAQRALRAEWNSDNSMYNAAEEGAARIPLDVYSQICELRRIFRL